jgi:hypothetical protein
MEHGLAACESLCSTKSVDSSASARCAASPSYHHATASRSRLLLPSSYLAIICCHTLWMTVVRLCMPLLIPHFSAIQRLVGQVAKGANYLSSLRHRATNPLLLLKHGVKSYDRGHDPTTEPANDRSPFGVTYRDSLNAPGVAQQADYWRPLSGFELWSTREGNSLAGISSR